MEKRVGLDQGVRFLVAPEMKDQLFGDWVEGEFPKGILDILGRVHSFLRHKPCLLLCPPVAISALGVHSCVHGKFSPGFCTPIVRNAQKVLECQRVRA